MKEQELRKHTTCCLCQKKLGQTGTPLFWTLEAKRYILDLAALERQQGLAMQLGGNGLLAHHMGPNEDLAKPIMQPAALTVCEPCALSNPIVQAAFSEETDQPLQDET